MKKTPPDEQLILMADEACMDVEEMAYYVILHQDMYEDDKELIKHCEEVVNG